MSNSENNLRIDYVEFPATDIEATKRFYTQAFGWKFEDYGPDYTSFQDGRLAGGFTKVDVIATGGPLVVIFATDLEQAQARVREAGGNIEGDILEFPGGPVSLSRSQRQPFVRLDGSAGREVRA
jgi:predicted enzyme related to lactoylglutathione lyase